MGYYSASEKGNPAIGKNMDEPEGHGSRRQDPATERQKLHAFTSIWYLK